MTAQASAPSVPGFRISAMSACFIVGVVVDVDDDDLRAAFLAGADRVGHDIDLRGHRIGAPDHDAIGLRHLARIGAAQRAGAHDIAGPGEIGADRAEEAGIFLGVAQPLDAVALHQPHRAGIEIGPDRLAAEALLGLEEFFGDEVERRFPARLLPAALALGAGAHAAASAAGRDGGSARHSARPWRR